MVKINKIKLVNFRNFANTEIDFDKNLNIFYGHNGSGKTNILESISMLTKGRGFRNTNILNIIKKNEENFLINSFLEVDKNNYDIKITTSFNSEKIKKITSVNDDISKESIKFINSTLSFLIFLPEMERLFQSSPSYRRNFIDRLIYSEKSDYNTLINKYKKNLIERNKILQLNSIDTNWINYIEKQISDIAIEIYKLRNEKINFLNSHIKKLNNSNNYNFKINLKLKDSFFNSNLDPEEYVANLSHGREFDRKFGGSKIGPHKSDIVAIINDDFDAALLSTGQQKTVVLMILLAQCDFLVNVKKIKPILLFDEICSHLDEGNRKILLDMVNKFEIQFFLTGTEKTLFSFLSTKLKFYNITEL